MTFEELYTLHAAPLLRRIRGYTQSHEEAEDLVQETFLRAWRLLPTLDQRHITSWLFVVACNLLRDQHRRRRLVTWCSLEGLPTEPIDPCTEDSHAEEMLQVQETAARVLSPETWAVVLASAQGASALEIAEQVGTSAASVKMRVSRARSALRRACAEEA
ncbi:MAG: sigma-70 family RNA polymerase sigma factor [Ktedonobacteraceae bacterium]|nr:sigma-70 family RNA polymerase sigma factor [Ktedonobacteraceae bacterium]